MSSSAPLGARQCGDDPKRYGTAECRQNYAGLPLTVASGRERAAPARHVLHRCFTTRSTNGPSTRCTPVPAARLFYDQCRTAGAASRRATWRRATPNTRRS